MLEPRTRTAYVLAEVAEERDRQDAKWGGPTHDDTHSPADFCAFIREHEARAEAALKGQPIREGDDYRRQVLRVAGLAVAALEQWDRHWKPALDRAEQQITDRLTALYGPDEDKWPKFTSEGRWTIEPREQARSGVCPECGGRGWTTTAYDLPCDRDTCERCSGHGMLAQRGEQVDNGK